MSTNVRTYHTLPYRPTPERASVVSTILRGIAGYDNVFTDYTRACSEKCFTCDACQRALHAVAQMLARPDAIIWEVWSDDGEHADIVGIIYFTDIELGTDAHAHYVFWDGALSGKTSVLREIRDWAFTDHDGWPALRRLTIEIPDYAWALASHAQRKLGFSGDFVYRRNDRTLRVEGVKRAAFRWRGADRDLLVLGCVRKESDE